MNRFSTTHTVIKISVQRSRDSHTLALLARLYQASKPRNAIPKPILSNSNIVYFKLIMPHYYFTEGPFLQLNKFNKTLDFMDDIATPPLTISAHKSRKKCSKTVNIPKDLGNLETSLCAFYCINVKPKH